MGDRRTPERVPEASFDAPGAPGASRPLDTRGALDGRPTVRSVIAAVVLAAVALTGIFFLPPVAAGGVLLVLAAGYLFRRYLFNWTTLLFVLAAVIMFVPVRRYALPIPLPFALEPYRVLIVLMLLGVAFCLVVSPSFHWRPIVWGWPIAAFLATAAVSIVANGTSLVEQGLASNSVGSLVQLAFLISVFVLVRQLLTSERIVYALLAFVVWAGVVVAFFAVIERATRFNVFLLLGNFLPLVVLRDDEETFRAGGARAYGSAQHPIALAVALCIIIPIAIHLAKYAGWPKNEISRKLLYGFGVAVLMLGILAAVSRTGVVVLGVMFLVTLVFIPRIAGILTAFIVPVGIIGTLVVPKQVDNAVGSFLDINTLIESQYSSPGYRGQGRLADLAPAFTEVVHSPFFGTGLGSRIVVGDDQNAYILDNQVLGTLMETGVVGLIGFAIFFLAPPISLIVFAFRTKLGRKYSMLAMTLAIAMSGYIAAMFFYDAFSFMQTFLILCLYLAVGAWLITEAGAARSAARSEAEAAAAPDASDAAEAVPPEAPARAVSAEPGPAT